MEINLRQFPSSRKRAITGLEAAEEEEADRRRQRRLAAVAAEADRAQDEHEEGEEDECNNYRALTPKSEPTFLLLT